MTASTHRLRDRLAIAQLNSDFCRALDRGTVDHFTALFTADALYTYGPRILRGSEQLREFYLGRTRDLPRTSRHFTSDLRVEFLDRARARGLSVCMTFSAPGLAPIESTIPAVVADFEDVYSFDGIRWYFAERHVRPQFTRAAVPV